VRSPDNSRCWLDSIAMPSAFRYRGLSLRRSLADAVAASCARRRTPLCGLRIMNHPNPRVGLSGKAMDGPVRVKK
jgi:hypothetical protein